MGWTATLQQVNVAVDGRATAVVLFSDGVRFKCLETFNLVGRTDATFRQEIAARRGQFAASYAFIADLEAHPGLDLSTDPAPTPPTDEERACAAFLAAWQIMRGLQRAVSAGLIASNDAELANACATASRLWDPRYADRI